MIKKLCVTLSLGIFLAKLREILCKPLCTPWLNSYFPFKKIIGTILLTPYISGKTIIMFNVQENKIKLLEVIKDSWFIVEEEQYIYTSVKEISYPEKHLMIINDGKEITIVTQQKNLSLLGNYDANKEKWRLLNIRCGNPFYCSGFIAYITGALADKGIDIVITSSYSNDLVMVMEKDLDLSVKTLMEVGFERRIH